MADDQGGVRCKASSSVRCAGRVRIELLSTSDARRPAIALPQRLALWRKRLRASRSGTSAALTLVPATVIDATAVVSARPAAMIRLPHGVEIEIDSAWPSWIAALVRELARSAS
jgi:hypothetical protein